MCRNSRKIQYDDGKLGGFRFHVECPVNICVCASHALYVQIYGGVERLYNKRPESRREALRVCGSVSGRDCDKTALSGLTPAPAENGGVFFEEARLVFECRKAYSQMMDARSFEDKGFLEKWYADSNFHKMYVGIIESAYKSV